MPAKNGSMVKREQLHKFTKNVDTHYNVGFVFKIKLTDMNNATCWDIWFYIRYCQEYSVQISLQSINKS